MREDRFISIVRKNRKTRHKWFRKSSQTYSEKCKKNTGLSKDEEDKEQQKHCLQNVFTNKNQ